MSNIDWSKAPEGCLGAVQVKEGKNDYPHGVFVTISEGYMEDGYHYCGKTHIGPCMDYYEFIPKPDTFGDEPHRTDDEIAIEDIKRIGQSIHDNINFEQDFLNEIKIGRASCRERV